MSRWDEKTLLQSRIRFSIRIACGLVERDSQLGAKRSRTNLTNTVYYSSQYRHFCINLPSITWYHIFVLLMYVTAQRVPLIATSRGINLETSSTWPLFSLDRNARRVGNSEIKAREKDTREKTLYEMSASPIARQATQSQSIPSKRIVIHDPNQLPTDYSSTPGGTLYSTTPGGQCILYSEVNFFLNLFLTIPDMKLWSNLCDFYGKKEKRKNLEILRIFY